LVAPPLHLRRFGVLDRGAQFGFRGQRHLGLDVAVIGSNTSANLPEVPLTSRTDKMSDCAHIFLQGTDFGGILQSLRRWKGFPRAHSICENAGPRFSAAYDNVECDCRKTLSVPRRGSGFFGAGFLRARFRRGRTTKQGFTTGAEDLVEKSPIAGDTGQYQRSIMVAITAIACLRAALRGSSGICAASMSIICSSLAANALRVFGLSRAISAPSVGMAQP